MPTRSSCWSPGVGRITFATDKTTARLAGEFYGNAINVMRGAEAIGDYIALDEQEAFDIEYWLLEEAKLQRMPAPKPMVGRIALVTGGAGGIGAATAARLLREGACVMLADRDGAAVEEVQAGFARQFGKDVVRAATCDVTDEAQVQAAFAACARNLAGWMFSSPMPGSPAPRRLNRPRWNCGTATTMCWRKAISSPPEPPGHCSRHEGSGRHSVVFIGSKNAVAAAAGASAYASAKAAANHLARCLALEGAPDGIRVNVVNPDAVIKGSKDLGRRLAQGTRRDAQIDPGEELEAHYRNRSMLKRDVLPEISPKPPMAGERHVGQVDRQHDQCRCGQCTGVCAVIEAPPLRCGERGRWMNLPLSADLIAEANARELAALEDDYASLGRKLGRSGIEIDAIKARVAAFSVAVPSWGAGRGGTRFAKFPIAGEPTNIHEKLEDCAVIKQLCRVTPRVSPHFPWDKVSDYAALREEAAELGLGFDAVNSNTFQDQPGQAHTLHHRLARLDARSHPPAGGRTQHRMHRNRPAARQPRHDRLGRRRHQFPRPAGPWPQP